MSETVQEFLSSCGLDINTIMNKMCFPGHFHKCYSNDQLFYCINIKCQKPFDTLCSACEKYLKEISIND